MCKKAMPREEKKKLHTKHIRCCKKKCYLGRACAPLYILSFAAKHINIGLCMYVLRLDGK